MLSLDCPSMNMKIVLFQAHSVCRTEFSRICPWRPTLFDGIFDESHIERCFGILSHFKIFTRFDLPDQTETISDSSRVCLDFWKGLSSQQWTQKLPLVFSQPGIPRKEKYLSTRWKRLWSTLEVNWFQQKIFYILSIIRIKLFRTWSERKRVPMNTIVK